MKITRSKNKIFSDERGQAILELIFFLPIMIILLSLLVSFGSSINGAINQQKVTRGYFYSRIKNNSLMPLNSHDDNAPYRSWRLFGMYFAGWMEKFDEGTDFPVQPCYKLNLPLEEREQNCQSYPGNSTNFIRVGTVYGLCGTTYLYEPADDQVYRLPLRNLNNAQINDSGCTIQQ
ncbi:MAG: hypothetical protein H6621_05715 [Halobacteriovoraceae bacterium]|nr:hypothetical protein [Halobacteriovoraceae bacterium]